MTQETISFHALVPAAGNGSRFGAKSPKQYLSLLGMPLMAHTIAALLAVPRIATVSVVLAPDDADWSTHAWPADPRLQVLRCGGATRAATVSAGVDALLRRYPGDDWVLVHDAARACIAPALVDRMLDRLQDDPVGGLLAVPVADTLKRANGSAKVTETVPRTDLWQAQTPQMFRLATLQRALQLASDVTDEASAVEALGLHPTLVAADASNFKITYPADLALAEQILRSRAEKDA